MQKISIGSRIRNPAGLRGTVKSGSVTMAGTYVVVEWDNGQQSIVKLNDLEVQQAA